MEGEVLLTVRLVEAGWTIDGAVAAHVFTRQRDAVAEATRLLEESAEGGVLTVQGGGGRAGSVRRITYRTDALPEADQAPGLAHRIKAVQQEAPRVPGLTRQIKAEGEHIDKVLDFALPVLGAAGAT